MTIYRAEVASDRFVANHTRPTERGDTTVEIKDLWMQRGVALLGVVESGAKTAIAIIAYLVVSAAEKILGGDKHSDIYADVVEYQFYSGVYLFHAVLSPNRALDRAWKGSGQSDLDDWGTKYDPKTTMLRQKMGFIGSVNVG